MASIERTAYPRFRRLVSVRELASLSPTEDEVAWARARARSGEHLLALVLTLRCFERLGYFPRPDEVPLAVVEHVRRCLELPEGTAPSRGSETAKWQHGLVRERVGVVHDPERARAVAAEAIRSGAEVKNNPPDLINVAARSPALGARRARVKPGPCPRAGLVARRVWLCQAALAGTGIQISAGRPRAGVAQFAA
jgi:hypothetical protein